MKKTTIHFEHQDMLLRCIRYRPSEKSIWCRKFWYVVGYVEGAGTLGWPPEVPKTYLGGLKVDNFTPKMTKISKMTINFIFLKKH